MKNIKYCLKWTAAVFGVFAIVGGFATALTYAFAQNNSSVTAIAAVLMGIVIITLITVFTDETIKIK